MIRTLRVLLSIDVVLWCEFDVVLFQYSGEPSKLGSGVFACDQVLELLDRLTRQAGKTMVMATHSRRVVGVADRILRIEDGRLEEVQV